MMAKMERLDMKFREVIKYQLFSGKPFQMKEGKDFFKAVKDNDYIKCLVLLRRNKYLVYDLDYVRSVLGLIVMVLQTNQTGLHWAAKRGYMQILNLLIQYKSDIDISDLVQLPLYIITYFKSGRTALQLALKYD